MNKGWTVWIEYKKFGEVMKSDEMKAACKEVADNIASKNSNFSASTYVGKKRAGAIIWDNSSVLDNKLLKAVR